MIFKQRKFTILYLAALVAFAPASTDIYLASMPLIQTLFHTSAAYVQLTLSLFFISFAIMQLIWGPLSDRWGRKPVLFIGIGIFIIGSLLCALSAHIIFLIIARVIQAIGACATIVTAMAMVKDYFPDSKEMTKVLSTMMSVAILAPIIAPTIGSYLLVYFNWQANFYFLALYGLILLVVTCFSEESHPIAVRKPLPLTNLLPAYREQICFRPFLLAVLALSTNFSVLFVFISSSSFIYIKIYQLPEAYFGYLFGLNATALILGTFLLHRLKTKFSAKKIIFSAITMISFAALVMLLALSIWSSSVFSIVIPTFVITFGVGMLYPETTSRALKNVVAYSGIASSLFGTFRFTLAALMGFVMGLVVVNSALPLAMVMFGLNFLTAIFMLFYYKLDSELIAVNSK